MSIETHTLTTDGAEITYDVRPGDGPTLLLIGELDLQYLHGYVERAASAIPHARVVHLPGVAHLPHLEADELTLSEISGFVSGIRDAGC